MEQLIPITGYAKTYEELCQKVAEPGEFYNVLEVQPFITYCKDEGIEIGDTTQTTDVIGWYKNKAELESNVKPTEGDVYITGDYSPYTRWKAEYVNYVMTWVEDGEEEKKILRKFKNLAMLTRAKVQPEEGVYYAVGAEAPYKVYGVVSRWTPVGAFISHVVDDIKQLWHKTQKSNPGEIAYIKGNYYLFTGALRDHGEGFEGWVQIDIPEPIENVRNHVFVVNSGEHYKLREGQYPGTLEFFKPRE